MKYFSCFRRIRVLRVVSLALIAIPFCAPLRAQQPTPSANTANNPTTEPTFDTLLSADSYKLYGEVRNVGQLLTTGGAAEIVEPIMKLASPGPEFESMLKFVKENAEALAPARLM